MIERLTALGHRVTVFTFADAYRLLSATGYEPHRIEGLQWKESKAGGVAAFGTAGNFFRYLRARNRSLDEIRQLALVERPDLFITDFEPLTALAAASLGVPCVSVDNQHRFCAPLGRDFPLTLRVYAYLAGQFVKRWIKHPRECIVAVFHRCPPSPAFQRVEALMRAHIARLKPTEGDHVLIYGRSELGRRMAEVAATVPAKFIMYGSDGPPAANVQYKQASYEQFAADLASARAVVALAGQQLMGEARYFGKPLLAVPMPNQHEQEINARYARIEGIGDYCSIRDLSRQRIVEFVDRRFSPARPANGVDQAIELLGIGHERI